MGVQAVTPLPVFLALQVGLVRHKDVPSGLHLRLPVPLMSQPFLSLDIFHHYIALT